MKICPNCHIRYEDDALKFCTRDGSPLVAEEDFTESASLDVSGALPQRVGDTQEIGPNSSDSEPEETAASEEVQPEIPRIVIQPKKNDTERPSGELAKENMAKKAKKGGTFKTVILTVLITTVVLAGGGWAIWMFAVGSDGFLFKPTADEPLPVTEPSPDPTPSPSPTPSPTPEESPSPSPSPTPTATPSPSPSPTPKPRDSQQGDGGTAVRPNPATNSEPIDGRPRQVTRQN
jgi:cell division septation protein DedD